MSRKGGPAVAVERECTLTRLNANVVTSVLVPRYLNVIDVARLMSVNRSHCKLLSSASSMWRALFVRTFPFVEPNSVDDLKHTPAVTTVTTSTAPMTLTAAAATKNDKPAIADGGTGGVDWRLRYREAYRWLSDNRHSLINLDAPLSLRRPELSEFGNVFDDGTNGWTKGSFKRSNKRPHPYHFLRFLLIGAANVGKRSFAKRLIDNISPLSASDPAVSAMVGALRTVLPEWFMLRYAKIVASNEVERMKQLFSDYLTDMQTTALRVESYASSLPSDSVFAFTRGLLTLQLWIDQPRPHTAQRMPSTSRFRRMDGLLCCYRIDDRKSFEFLRNDQLSVIGNEMKAAKADNSMYNLCCAAGMRKLLMWCRAYNLISSRRDNTATASSVAGHRR